MVIAGTATGILMGGNLDVIGTAVGWCCPSFADGEYTRHLRPNNAGETCSREPDLKVVRDLRLRSGGCSLLKNWGRLVDFRDAEEDQRRIRSGLQTAVCVVDIDVGFSEA